MKQVLHSLRHGGYYSKVMLIIALIVAAPSLVAIFYPEEAGEVFAFIIPAVVIGILGIILAFVTDDNKTSVRRVWNSPMKRGSLPVLFAWFCGIIGGTIPFIIGGYLSPVQSLFESVSGWTTTGLTVVDVNTLPHMFLFHRAFMQYCGGLGFIIVIAIVLHGKQLTSMYNAEGHPDGIMPNLRKTSLTIIAIYAGGLVIGTALYCIFGMSFFEAVCHTMSALSTAGFSTRNGSIAEYASFPIEAVTVLLMLVGSTNFAVLLLLVRRRFKRAAKVSEVRFMFASAAVFIVLMLIPLIKNLGMDLWESLRHSVFSVVSIFSTTGYSIADYSAWPAFAICLIMLLMVLGGCTGSTAGGIKMLRAYIIVRITKENIQRRMSPNLSIRVLRYSRPQGEAEIDDRLVRDTFEFVTVYLGLLIAGTLLIILFENCSLGEAAFEFASAFGTIGISNGLTMQASTGTLIVEMLGMLMGRLEIFILFIGLSSLVQKMRASLSKKA